MPTRGSRGGARTLSPIPTDSRSMKTCVLGFGIIFVGLVPMTVWVLHAGLEHTNTARSRALAQAVRSYESGGALTNASLPDHRNHDTLIDSTRREGDRLREKLQRLHRPGRLRWRINVVVDQDVSGLERLLASLTQARYTESVALTVHVNSEQPSRLHDVLVDIKWPHGPLDVRVRHSRAYAELGDMESWYPANDAEWALLLDTSTVVGQEFFSWLIQSRRVCESNPSCIGVSLNSPSTDAAGHSIVTRLKGPAYLAQVPPTLGAAFKPDPWRTFRRWAEHRAPTTDAAELNLGPAGLWPTAWRRHFLELMLIMDWFFLYPFLNGGVAAHAIRQGENLVGALLDTEAPKLPQTSKLQQLNHLYEPILLVTDALLASRRPLPTPPVNRTEACASYSPQSHAAIVQTGLTIVIGHLYNQARFGGFLKNILAFCDYPDVRRIVVVWYFARLLPPIVGKCGLKSRTTVHFLIPRTVDSLSNRFTPTYRILTDVVVTVDDDISVTKRDLRRMAATLREQKLERVVGPFPRWHDSQGKYLWLPTASTKKGYPIILTKLHLSPYWLYHSYFCDPIYTPQRAIVDRSFNGEDILYMRVAGDHKVLPLYIITIDPIIDSGLQGLHNRSDHTRERSAMVRSCNFNDSHWSGDVVLPPGTALSAYNHSLYVNVYEGKLKECYDCHHESHDPLNGRTIEVADPTCSSGLLTQSTCCAKECGTCAGVGCDLRRPGPTACCGGVIEKSHRSCDIYQPPCVVMQTQSTQHVP